MLHITNGDSAVQRILQAGIPGEVLPWRDVLHDGPVPAGLTLHELSRVRARFIADQGWAPVEQVMREFAERDAALNDSGAHEEVVLWFEIDLYDQLQLVQLLDWFAGHDPGDTRLSLVQADEYLGPASVDRLKTMFEERERVTEGQRLLGASAWDVFRASDPTGITDLLGEDLSMLPYLAEALRRHLQQFPSVRNGLSRSEQQALRAIGDGRSAMKDAYFASHHESEDPVFLGDTVFALYLERLSQGSAPLVLYRDGSRIEETGRASQMPGFWEREVVLTNAGRDVLDGRSDQIKLNGIDRWQGGVHLQAGGHVWRWDEASGMLIKST